MEYPPGWQKKNRRKTRIKKWNALFGHNTQGDANPGERWSRNHTLKTKKKDVKVHKQGGKKMIYNRNASRGSHGRGVILGGQNQG